jgi:hypothetical protein
MDLHMQPRLLSAMVQGRDSLPIGMGWRLKCYTLPAVHAAHIVHTVHGVLVLGRARLGDCRVEIIKAAAQIVAEGAGEAFNELRMVLAEINNNISLEEFKAIKLRIGDKIVDMVAKIAALPKFE